MRPHNLPMRQATNRGVTLLELCFGLAIVALVAGFAAPGFQASLRAAAVRAAAFELLAGLERTRADSIIESRVGTWCAVDVAGNCAAARIATRAWRAALDGTAQPAPLLHTLPAGVVVHASRNPLRFWPDALAGSTGTLTICDERGIAAPRSIVVSQNGRARIAAAQPRACS